MNFPINVKCGWENLNILFKVKSIFILHLLFVKYLISSICGSYISSTRHVSSTVSIFDNNVGQLISNIFELLIYHWGRKTLTQSDLHQNYKFWRLFKLMFKLILILAKVIMHLSIRFHVVWNVGMSECRVFLQTFITQIYSPLPGNSSLSVWYNVFVLRIPFELKRRRPNDLCMREYINTLATEFAVCITINRVLTVTVIA